MHARLQERLAAEKRLAVVVQPRGVMQGPALTFQVLMGEAHCVSNVIAFLRKQLCLAADRALHVYSADDKVLRPRANLLEISRGCPSEDGFLYLYYSDAPAFGAAH